MIKSTGKRKEDSYMELYDLKVNGRVNPIGTAFSRLVCSWKVRNQNGKKQKYAKIEVSLEPGFLTILYQIEGKEINSIAQPLKLNLLPRTRYYWRVFVETDEGDTAVSQSAFFETGKMKEVWHGKWISTQKEDSFHPRFQKDFVLKRPIASARLYISGLGLFEAEINGKKAGEEYLAPFHIDYRDGVQYCTYDVTELLTEENSLSVILGNGWYKGRLGYTGLKEVYGNRFLMIAEIHILYEDGTEDIIATDKTWHYQGSEIAWSDIYDGECQDRLLWKEKENHWKPSVETEGLPLVERYSLPLTSHEILGVKEVIHTPSGETVLDFGQNFAGFVEFHGKMDSGEWLKLEFGEILQDGNFYRENYRTAKAQFLYRSDGMWRKVRPHFTYYGFRYVKVEGPDEIRAEDFNGNALYSEVQRTGWFESSNQLLNQLYQNTMWGLKSNFTDMPTDCPQRDERLGWTGDAQVFSQTASYHMDTKAFYEKFLIDLRKDQIRNGGKVAMYLPNLQPGLSGSVWGDAATIIPMTLYQYYGDKELLREQYPLMKSWVEYIHSEDVKRGQKNLWDFGFHLGDWLALDGVTQTSMVGATDPCFIASVYYFNSVKLTAKAAEVLDKTEDAKEYDKLAEGIKVQILHHYFTPSGKLAVDTQTAYYICLYFGIYRSRETVVEGLKKRLKQDCYEIKSGFVGAPIMCKVLAEAGLINLAYDFLFQESYPGWMYEVKLGATTVWERWNSVLPDGKISDTGMNSLNHYAYGSVAEFLYRYTAGIQATCPGYQTVKIAPQPVSALAWMDCSYDSAAGRYRVRWEILNDQEIKLQVEIPFNAGAQLYLPGDDGGAIELEAGSYEYRYKPQKDYCHRYREESRLEQMKADTQVLKIARKKCKNLYEMLLHGDKEILSRSLKELKSSMFSGLDQEELESAAMSILSIYTRDNIEESEA